MVAAGWSEVKLFFKMFFFSFIFVVLFLFVFLYIKIHHIWAADESRCTPWILPDQFFIGPNSLTTWHKAHFLYYVWTWLDVPSDSFKSLLSYFLNSVLQSYSLVSRSCAAVAVTETTHCCPSLDSTAGDKTCIKMLHSSLKINKSLQWLDKKNNLLNCAHVFACSETVPAFQLTKAFGRRLLLPLEGRATGEIISQRIVSLLDLKWINKLVIEAMADRVS